MSPLNGEKHMTAKRTLAKIAGVLAGASMVVVPLTATAATAAPVSGQVQAKGMEFYDDFWTYKECKTVGKWGLEHGKWTVYDCQESPIDWDLYVDK